MNTKRTFGFTVILILLGLIGQVTTSSLVLAAPAITISPTGGPWGTSVSVTGSGFDAAETGIAVTYDGTTVATGITASAEGTWSATFNVPDLSSAGSHTVDAYGSATAASNVPNMTFTVPSVAISLSTTSAVPGTSVTVTGSGFGAAESEIRVTYDGTTVATGITASTQGTWSATFTVPASSSPGSHTVDAYGSSTMASSVPNMTFAVPSAAISLNAASAVPGTSVTVTGSGFAAAETGITVTYDGTMVITGIMASTQGTWGATFSVPTSASGSHSIDAYGSTTQATSVGEVTLMVRAGISISKNSAVSGTSVTATGSGFAAAETGITVTYDGTMVATGITASTEGTWSATFSVPASSPGSHTIDAYSYSTMASSIPDVTFTVPSAAISLSATSAVPGASVTVKGSGFAAAETGITVTYDGTTVATGITVNTQGAWSATFNVPTSASGAHSIDAYGSTTQAADVPQATLMVSASITVSRNSGASGTSVTVTGSGFGAAETGITVTYDRITVATGIIATTEGTWSATFNVPTSASGAHSIGAYGLATQASSVHQEAFMVGAGISVNQSSGASGTSVTVTGSGFAAAETGITVTYDGTTVTTGITASTEGTWSATFSVPTSAFGSHNIDAYGSTTQAASVGEVGFSVTPAISASPASGYVGLKVNIAGSGFAPDSTIRYFYDDTEISGEKAMADASGSFAESISVPKSKTGDHSISAMDTQGNEAKVIFTIESVTPDTPSLLSPQNGSRHSILGDITPTFEWSAVTNDPNGVTYTLQIDKSSDFPHPILEKNNITGTSYKLTEAEALSRGHYYWRVKAVDNASNESVWAQPSSLKSGLMALWTLVIIIILCIVAAGGIGYLLLVFLRRRRMREAVVVVPDETEEEMFPILGDWREAPSEEAPKLHAPQIRALPRPTKELQRMSHEEQARFKLIADFVQSLPLVEPGYTVDWIVDLVETATGSTDSQQVYEQLLQGQLEARYEPAWTGHPLWLEMRSMLGEHPIMRSLDDFLEAVNDCSSEGLLLLGEIYRDCRIDVPSDFLGNGGWIFIATVYSDATGWFRGKSLQEPSYREYTIKGVSPDGEKNVVWLYGEETTSFAGPLIQAQDEEEALQFRALHLGLRHSYRNSERARQLVEIISQLELQRNRLVKAFAQISGSPD